MIWRRAGRWRLSKTAAELRNHRRAAWLAAHQTASFRIKASLKLALEAAAEADRRSVSSWVEIALEAELIRRGFLKDR
jgi:hypothetical protein